MIRLFISDFDGTLLNGSHTISSKTKQAIEDLRASGVSFMPASGRDYFMIMNEMEKVNLTPKCIALNGGELYDNDGTLLMSNPIHKKALIEIVEAISGYDIDLVFFCEDGRNVHLDVSVKEEYFKKRKEEHPFFSTMPKEIGDAFFEKLEMITVFEKDLEKILTKHIMKIDLFFKSMSLREDFMERLNLIEGITVTSSIPENLEINSTYATKGHMAQKVCEFYGYELDEVVVIGDSSNDASMLKMFPNSYAMGNASDEVKQCAKHIAATNIEDGVAKVMYEIIEKNAREQ